MEYSDFEIKLGPRLDETRYRVTVKHAATGEAQGEFRVPLTAEQLELLILRLRLHRTPVRRMKSQEWQNARTFGLNLFRALLTGAVHEQFNAALDASARAGKGLRLKLTLDASAPELGDYPWEFLCDPANDQFLSLMEATPLVRYVQVNTPIAPLNLTPPLRMLAMVASPNDYEPLDVKRERENLETALAEMRAAGLLELDWLSDAQADALRAQLLRKAYHIFHFIGHGGFDPHANMGELVFQDAHGRAHNLGADRLAYLLGNHRTLRLIVLNACEGARTSRQDPFGSTAVTLLRTGNLPAVVAMQFEISDRAAIDFARGFYSALAAGRPVDAAVTQGRQAIYVQDNDVEWCTPVLYLRAPDGIVFDVARSAAPHTAAVAVEPAASHIASVSPKPEAPPGKPDAKPKAAAKKEKPLPAAPSAPPAEINTLLEQARAQIQAKQFDKALSILARAKKLDAQNAHVYFLWGIASAEKRWAEGKGSGKQPLLDLEHAIALDAHNVEFYVEWARIAARGGVARHKILARLKEAQKIFPEHAELYYLRAKEYVPSQYETALNEIDRAIALAPDRAAYHAQRAQIQTQALALKNAKIDTARALADSQRAMELEPANPDYVISQAQWLSRAGKSANARAEFERAIQLNPRRAESYRARAGWFEQQNDYAHALEDFARAIQLEPDNGALYWWRGRCYNRKGERAAARRDFEQALARGWSLAEWDIKRLE